MKKGVVRRVKPKGELEALPLEAPLQQPKKRRGSHKLPEAKCVRTDSEKNVNEFSSSAQPVPPLPMLPIPPQNVIPPIQPELATAGAYRNNCAFHCLAHFLSSKSESELKYLFECYPIYNEILIAFYEHYKLGENYDFDDFVGLLNNFKHPDDVETVLGEVLRNVTRTMINQGPHPKLEEIEELQATHLVSDALIGRFAIALGGELIVHPEPGAPKEFDLIFKDENPKSLTWEMHLYHTLKGGGHYNFTHQNPFQNVIHNSLYIQAEDGRRKPIGDVKLNELTYLVGEAEQAQAIEAAVQAEYRSIIENKHSEQEQRNGICLLL